jgi:two-component system, NtrC family, nitrogen regulation response regulator NtrX
MDKKPFIIVVDDDRNILNLLKEVIESMDLTPICCETADDCLNQLRATDAKLVLSDIVMPEMDGVELLRRILAVRPDTNVIMMTGMDDIDVAKKCLAMGAKDFITKPLDIEYLKTSTFSEIVRYL